MSKILDGTGVTLIQLHHTCCFCCLKWRTVVQSHSFFIISLLVLLVFIGTWCFEKMYKNILFCTHWVLHLVVNILIFVWHLSKTHNWKPLVEPNFLPFPQSSSTFLWSNYLQHQANCVWKMFLHCIWINQHWTGLKRVSFI